MLKVGHLITSVDIPILNIYNLCKHKISKELQHYVITDNRYDFIDFFKHDDIPCFVVNNEKAYQNLFKKTDIIHLHWIGYNRKEHDLVKGSQVPFLVTLYKPEKLPASIPFVICPFNFIKEIQGRPRNSMVIHDGINIKRFSKISNDVSLKAKNTEKTKKSILIAPDVITQCNDYFWILMQEFLLKNSNSELRIICPGWRSLNLIKAINNKKQVYTSIALSDVAIYTPFTSDVLKIQNSFHFVMIAMAMGMPCIVSKNEIFDEVIKHRKNGIVFSGDKPIHFIEGVKELLQNRSLRKRCIVNAYQTVHDKFDVKLNVSKYEAVLLAFVKKQKLRI